jgi:hypothetical protein
MDGLDWDGGLETRHDYIHELSSQLFLHDHESMSMNG